MANITVSNTSSDLSGNTLLTAQGSYNVVGTLTFQRAPSAPFVVQAGSGNVANLDASLLQGNAPSAFAQLAQANTYSAGGQLITVANETVMSWATRFSASNALVGFGIGNSNGFGYVGWNTRPQSGSDVPLYDITGAAGRIFSDSSGNINFQTAPSGTAGTSATMTTQMALTQAGLLSVNGGGTHTFAGAVSGGGNIVKVNNTQAAAASQYGGFEADADNGAISTVIRQYSNSSGTLGFTGGAAAGSGASFIQGGGTSGLAFAAAGGSGVVSFYTGGSTTQRWGINAAGDFVVGGSSHIAASIGAPSVASGFGGGSVAGIDYAFTITLGGSANTGGTINFGHTWSTAPVCVGSLDVQGNIKSGGVNGFNFSPHPTTTQMSISYDSVTSPNQLIYIHCLSS